MSDTPNMALTDTAIRAAKPRSTPYKLADSGGLYLLVNASGSRLWRLKYRVDGREKVLSIGPYPAVTLAKAREKRDEAKTLLAEGGDPSQAKLDAKREIEREASSSFRAIADEYLNKLRREGRAPATITKVEWLLGLVYGHIGNKPIREITASNILDALRQIEKRGRYETARRARSTIGSVFRYAIAITLADNDPTFALRGALITPPVKHRAAIIDPQGFGGLLRAIDSFDGHQTTKVALKLMALLFPRPGELRFATWSEFDFEKSIWTISVENNKKRHSYRIPLSPRAKKLLTELREITGDTTLLFPSIRSATRPISENTLNAALSRLGYGSEEATAHGFRASAGTLLNESGRWHPDAIERQLDHVESNEVRRAYTRGEHWDERVAMMQWWGEYLEELKASGIHAV